MAFNFKHFFDQALERGERIKTQMFDEVLESPVVQRLLQNEKLIQGVISLFTAKEKVEKKVQKSVKALFKKFEIPTLTDYSQLAHRLAQLEGSLEELKVRRSSPAREVSHKAASLPAGKPIRSRKSGNGRS